MLSIQITVISGYNLNIISFIYTYYHQLQVHKFEQDQQTRT